MSRLTEIALQVMSWEHNHWRQVNALLDRGCPPGSAKEVRQALYEVIARQDPDLTVAQINVLLDIEMNGAT